MKLKILSPQWGYEDLPLETFFTNVKEARFDGVDTWMPENKEESRQFIKLLEQYQLSIVSHQHQAKGNNIKEFCKSFEYYLHVSNECAPLLINSHSGKDYFTLDEQLAVIDSAENFAVMNNVKVVHETHRGRIGFSPVSVRDLFRLRPDMKITADFSHWVCVSESFLEHFSPELTQAIARTEHIHARVGHKEGPQIPDPRLPHWQKEVNYFMELWERILALRKMEGKGMTTFTTEFGPPPYMWTNSETNQPIVNQWDVNLYMKDLLEQQFQAYNQ